MKTLSTVFEYTLDRYMCHSDHDHRNLWVEFKYCISVYSIALNFNWKIDYENKILNIDV